MKWSHPLSLAMTAEEDFRTTGVIRKVVHGIFTLFSELFLLLWYSKYTPMISCHIDYTVRICFDFLLKPHCIQSSQVLVPAGTSKSTLRRHGIQAVTRVTACIANAVTLWRCLQQCVLAASRYLWVHWRHQPWNSCIEYSVALILRRF
jgi:hypothetical protein